MHCIQVVYSHPKCECVDGQAKQVETLPDCDPLWTVCIDAYTVVRLEERCSSVQVNVVELTTCSDPNQYATPSAKADFKV